ncbi:hypothetical protein FRB97_001725 [Tulasnella sp. 331]|nr:hypothetical protein FRB97_001725 [Tulasnella sp. 331]
MPSVHHLAVELIANIFEQVLSPNTISSPLIVRKRQLEAITLSHIDSRTRAIALHSAPAVWTTIYIDLKPGSWQLAKLFYGRSGVLRLQVHLNMRHARRRISVPFEVSRPLSGVRSRVEALLVNASPRMRGQLAVMLRCITAPRLHELTLLYEGRGETREWEWSVKHLPGAENVKKVALAGVRVDCLKEPLPFVTHLRLIGRPERQIPPPSMEFVRDIARNIPNLQSLILRGMCHLNNDLMNIQEPLVLHSLHHIEISKATHLFTASILMILKAENLENHPYRQ